MQIEDVWRFIFEFQEWSNFRSHQFRIEVEGQEVIPQVIQTQAEAKTTGSNKGKGKASYKKWAKTEQSFLLNLWAEKKKNDHLKLQDARKVRQEICHKIETNSSRKKRHLKNVSKRSSIWLENHTKSWNKSQMGGHRHKSVSTTKQTEFFAQGIL